MDTDNAASGRRDAEPSTVKDRLITFMKARRIRPSELTKNLGVSSAYVNTLRKSLPEEKVQALCAIYPELNRDWLLFGEGEMLRSPQRRSARAEMHEVPLLPVCAFAGRLQNWSEGVRPDDCEMLATAIPGVEMAIRLSGDSMEPELHDGSILYIRRINDKSYIPWGNPVVIDTENGVLVKALYPSPDGRRHVQARSFNPNYPPFELPTSEIYGIYRVLAVVKHYNTM